jgi:hypothetical protein
VSLLSVLGVPSAGAADSLITPADILPGECTPEAVAPFTTVDCRFPLRDAGLRVDALQGVVADLNVVFDEQNGEQVACLVDGQELVCPAIPTYYLDGRYTVSLIVGGERTEALASFVVEDWVDIETTFTAIGGEPLVFARRPLELWVDDLSGERVWALVRERASLRPVAVFDIGEPDPDDFLHRIDLSSLPPGRYRVDPCLGASSVGCRRVVGGISVQVGTGELVPLLPGSVRDGADRINVVIAGSGFDDIAEVRTMALDLLGLDGPVGLVDGEPVGQGGVQAHRVAFGPFSTEPLRSARHVFNLWLLTDLVADDHALFHDAPPRGSGLIGTEGFDLPNVHITTLHLQRPGGYGRSEAGWMSLDGEGPPDLDPGTLVFGGAYLSIPSSDRFDAIETLTHEWGHALFDLRDEYVEYGSEQSVTHGYPNCAPDLDTAQEWWGPLDGAVDSFVEEFLATYRAFGLAPPEGVVEDVTVSFVDAAGCYSPLDGEAVRPTSDSLMRSEVPIFGAVNRHQVEAVLGLFSGMAPAGPGDVILSCSAFGDTDLACRGTLRPWVEVPADGFTAVADADSAWCFAQGASDEDLALVTCETVALQGDGPWDVRLEADGVVVAQTNVATTTSTTTTSTTTTTTTTTAPQAAAATTTAPSAAPTVPAPGGSRGASGLVLLVLGLVLGVGIGAAWTLRRRP